LHLHLRSRDYMASTEFLDADPPRSCQQLYYTRSATWEGPGEALQAGQICQSGLKEFTSPPSSSGWPTERLSISAEAIQPPRYLSSFGLEDHAALGAWQVPCKARRALGEPYSGTLLAPPAAKPLTLDVSSCMPDIVLLDVDTDSASESGDVQHHSAAAVDDLLITFGSSCPADRLNAARLSRSAPGTPTCRSAPVAPLTPAMVQALLQASTSHPCVATPRSSRANSRRASGLCRRSSAISSLRPCPENVEEEEKVVEEEERSHRGGITGTSAPLPHHSSITQPLGALSHPDGLLSNSSIAGISEYGSYAKPGEVHSAPNLGLPARLLPVLPVAAASMFSKISRRSEQGGVGKQAAAAAAASPRAHSSSSTIGSRGERSRLFACFTASDAS